MQYISFCPDWLINRKASPSWDIDLWCNHETENLISNYFRRDGWFEKESWEGEMPCAGMNTLHAHQLDPRNKFSDWLSSNDYTCEEERERESWKKDSVEGKSSNLHNTYDDNQQSWNEQPESRGFRNSIEQLQHLHTSTSRKKMKERKEKTRQPNKLGRRNKVEKFLSCLPGLWWRVMRSEMK